jgi:hypothetical protein|tara:strand:+ start:1542 stop:1715 length:174 start_codon:yes stop_codon:yes gene_type:complete
MSITINHQTNDISVTSGSLTIDGAAADNASTINGKSISIVTALPATPDANTIYFVTG